MKNPAKIALALLIFIFGGASNVYISAIADITLTAHSPPKTVPKFGECLHQVLNVPSCQKMYLLIQMLIIVFAVWLVAIHRKPYQSDLVQITKDIQIPAPAGQGQHGAARFMSAKEKRKKFAGFTLDANTPVISDLMKCGEKIKGEVKTYGKAHPELLKKPVPEYTPGDREYTEKEWQYEVELAKIQERRDEKRKRRKEKFEKFLNKLKNSKPRFISEMREERLKEKEQNEKIKPRKPLKIKQESAFLWNAKILTAKIRHKIELTNYKIQRGKKEAAARNTECVSKGGIVIDKTEKGGAERIFCLDKDIHTLIIGGTGSGKSRCLVIQSICALALAGESIIVSDPKGELYSYTAPMLRRLGYKVRIIDFQNTDKSHCYNPLQSIIDAVNIGDIDLAQMCAWDLVCFLVEKSDRSEPIWRNGEMAVLAAGILCVVFDNKDNPRFQNLTNVYWFIAKMCKEVIIKETDDEGKTQTRKVLPVTEYVKNLPDTHPAKPLLGIAEIAPDKTAGSFYTSALTTLRLFTAKGVYNVTRQSDFELSSIGQNKEAVFFILPDEKTTFYPIVTLIVSQQYEQFVKYAKERGNRLPNRVNFVLDEFGNFAAISDFETKMTVARGYGIRFNLFLQSMEQLTKKYGKEVAAIIKGNCTAWIYLKTKDAETLEEISKQLGEYTTTSYSLGSSIQKYSTPSSSQNVQLAGRRLLMVNDLTKFERPYQLVMSEGNPAVMLSPDLSKWKFNDILGLGNPVHNMFLIARSQENRADYAKNDEDAALWGIWRKWTGELPPMSAETDKTEQNNRRNSAKKRDSRAADIVGKRVDEQVTVRFKSFGTGTRKGELS